jgi:hypothetical protein
MELFGYVFAIIILLATGFIIGWFTHRRAVHLKIESIMQRLEKGMTDNVIEVRIERHDDSIYVYRADNYEFMAKGINGGELGKELASRFPGKSFAAPREQIEKSGIRNVTL